MPWAIRAKNIDEVEYDSETYVLITSKGGFIASAFVCWTDEPEVHIYLGMQSNLISQTDKELDCSGWTCEEHVATEIWFSNPTTKVKINFVENRNHMFNQDKPIGQEIIVQIMFVQGDDVKKDDIIIACLKNNVKELTFWQRVWVWFIGDG